MTLNFATGKNAKAVCDICGCRSEYGDLQPLIRAGYKTSVMACSYCWDQDHPQLFLGRKPIRDAVSLRRARPDSGAPSSRYMFDKTKLVSPPVQVNGAVVSATKWFATGGTVVREAIRDPFGGWANAFVEDTSAGVHGISTRLAITDGANITFSALVKAAPVTREYFAIRTEDTVDATPMYTDVWTQSTGVWLGVGSVLGAGVNISRASVPLGNGWWRYTVVHNLGVGAPIVRINLYGRDLTSTGYIGDGRIAFYYKEEPVTTSP